MKAKIAITLDAELLHRLDKMAAHLETSRSAMLERLLYDGLNDQEPVVDYLVSDVGRAGWKKVVPNLPYPDKVFMASIGIALSGAERRELMQVVQAINAGGAFVFVDGKLGAKI
jgi:Ribbon-helix-helix protein, copG family